MPAAAGSTLGARVAGTQPLWVVGVWVLAVAALAVAGVRAALAGPAGGARRTDAGVALVAHCVRRFGGITGDVLGAAVEVTTTVAAVGLAIGS